MIKMLTMMKTMKMTKMTNMMVKGMKMKTKTEDELVKRRFACKL